MWELDCEESWAPKNWCFWTVVLEKTLASPLDCKEIQPVHQSILKEISLGVHWKDWCWSWNSHTVATWCEELTHWKRLWCWARLKAGGEGDDRGWNGWIASPTPRVHPNPCWSSRWCHPTISSSVVPFSSCPQSFPASESFPVSQLSTSGGQSIGVSASTSALPMNTQTDLL